MVRVKIIEQEVFRIRVSQSKNRKHISLRVRWMIIDIQMRDRDAERRSSKVSQLTRLFMNYPGLRYVLSPIEWRR